MLQHAGRKAAHLLWLLLVTLAPGALADPTSPPAPPRLAFVGLHGGVFEVLKPFEAELAVRLDYVTDEQIAARRADFSGFAAVFLQHLRPQDTDALRAGLAAARAKNPGLRVFMLTGTAPDVGRDAAGRPLIEEDPELAGYYASAARESLRRLVIYALVKCAGRTDLKIEPPVDGPGLGFYHPDHEGLFPSAAEFIAWARQRGLDPDARPRAAVAVHNMHLAFQQPRVVDALVRRLEKEGILAAAVIDTPGRDRPSGPGATPDAYQAFLLEFHPGAVIHTCHGTEPVAFREQLGAPHLSSLFFRKKSIDQWRASPDGLDANEVLFEVATQEVLGAIEPQVGAGTRAGGGSDEAFAPIDERIDHLVRRTAAWLSLGRKNNAEKRIAIVYYDRELGKGELMRGSASGMFLNAPRSLVKLLRRMKEAGYAVDPLPADEDELLRWLMDRGRQVGVWAPGELDRLVREGRPALIPLAAYERWLSARVPEPARKQLVAQWGPAPGRFLVWEDERKEKFIVIPRLELGNVVLLPQPLRGEAHDPSLVHDRLVPPPHNYVATYLWLAEGLHADAVVHFGTHGSELALPGKSVGLGEADWSDIVLGSLPNINPWVINNLGESLPAKRRAYAVLVGHLTPPLVNAGLSDELLNLHNDLDKCETLETGALREKFRAAITRSVLAVRLDRDLHLDLAPGRLLTDAEMTRVTAYLHRIHNETTPVSLHVLGEPPRADLLVPNLVTCLRKKFLDDLGTVVPAPPGEDKLPGERQKHLRAAAEEAVRLVVGKKLAALDAVRAVGGRPAGDALPEELERGFRLAVDLAERYGHTGAELDNLLAALDGRFVPPGPGNDPTRNPGAVPTGRNLFVLNPEEVPSRPSWEVGKDLAERFLRDHVARHGRYPEKVGFDLSSFATFADYGVMEAQILWLLGVEPLWDEKNVVADVNVIPREQLGRPRIDVFISALSYYRDNLPSRMVLLDRAVRKVAALDEPDNGVRRGTRAVEDRLRAHGMAPAQAAALAPARIFGYPAGQYGSANYYYLVERSGEWDTRAQLMEAYLAQVRNVYTEGVWGEAAPETYDAAIQGTEVVLRTWNDPLRSPLANKYTWYMGGSLALAVKHLTGKEPEFILSDIRDPDLARMVSAADALRQEYRVRLFNRKWIEGMMKEGYAGADQVAVMVSNTLGWEIMREGSVEADVWQEIRSIYVDDKYGLGLPAWMEGQNPFAQQEVLEIMLEAARKGYWSADAATVRALAERYAASVARHGEGGGLRGGGNAKLDGYVEKALRAPGGKVVPEELLAQYRRRGAEQGAVAVRPGPAPAPAAAALPVGAAPGAGPSPAAARPAGDPAVRPAPLARSVAGRKLERVEAPARPAPVPAAAAPALPWLSLPLGLAVVAVLLVLYGFLQARRAA